MIALQSIEQHAPSFTDEGVQKLFSENRDRYIAQSAATVGGVVAPLPPRDGLSESRRAELKAALDDIENCPVEEVNGKIRFHLATGPIDVDRQTAVFMRWKRKYA